MGGLGTHLKETNLVLLEKWFSSKRDSLWKSTVPSRYGLSSKGWDCNANHDPSMSLIWSMSILSLFIHYIRFVAGNGRSIKFWKDIWWSNQSHS